MMCYLPSGRKVFSTPKVLIGLRAQDYRHPKAATADEMRIQDLLMHAPGSHILGSNFSRSRSASKKIAKAPKPSLHRLAPGPVAAVLRKLRWALRRVRWALLKMRGPL